MQRREPKIGPRDRKGHRRPKEENDTGENPCRNSLFWLGLEIRGFVGLDGGRDRDRTYDPLIVEPAFGTQVRSKVLIRTRR
jgi:hypothetical protein